jgi:hypothetical protein
VGLFPLSTAMMTQPPEIGSFLNSGINPPILGFVFSFLGYYITIRYNLLERL